MRFREFPPGNDAGGRREAQIMVRHPNYSGMQMDQITRLYIPAHFVTKLRMLQGSDLLFAVESGISISENPEFRFSFRPSGAAFRAEGEDNEGTKFSATWPAAAA
jgi:sulfur-oxidizing protein SoxY